MGEIAITVWYGTHVGPPHPPMRPMRGADGADERGHEGGIELSALSPPRVRGLFESLSDILYYVTMGEWEKERRRSLSLY